MSKLKDTFRSLLRRAGFELLHRNDDPVLAELRKLHETLRLELGNRIRWSDTLARPAAHACLRHLLELHRIDLLLDVGANQGQFAQLARHVGYTGEIVSFEPLSRYREVLRKAANEDGRWRIIASAVGSQAAELDLNVCADDSFSSLHTLNDSARARFGGHVAVDSVERVSVCTLDSLWPELDQGRGRRVLLKTDTQGHDLAVLSGASAVLPWTCAVVTEAAIQPIYAGAPRFVEIAAWLERAGFVLSGVFPTSHRPEDLSLIEVDAFFTKLRA
jgi:FkbM family methyltransferase